MPDVEAGRRGGENRVGERTGVGRRPCFRGGTGTGAAERGLLAEGAASIFRVLDRLGGGTSGFGFSSESCISFADLKEAGDSGSFSLCIELDACRAAVIERFTSSDNGRVWSEPRCGGGLGGGGVLMRNCVNWAGFCLIGGDFNGSFCGVLKYAAPSTNGVGGSSILCFGFGLTGGGVCVLCLERGISLCGSGGSLKARCGLGDRTGGGEC